MKPTRILGLALCLLLLAPTARATFSIAAVDPATGEVGSAGASCIAGSIILSDVHPGVGVIHTQSYWNAQNQQNAAALMAAGWSPQEIIDWLVANDAQGNPTIRQYGIADLGAGGRSAAYTGVNCGNWKGHLTGPGYAVAGNILLGPEIIADMETAFLSTQGHLAFRLMAALQAANVPGADTRCLANNKPAISAFVRVARPGETPGNYFLDLNVNNTLPAQNPIDMLQELFDAWVTTAVAVDAPAPATIVLHAAHPNPFNPLTTLSFELTRAARVRLAVYDAAGREVALLIDGARGGGTHELSWRPGPSVGSGVYYLRLETGAAAATGRLVLLK